MSVNIHRSRGEVYLAVSDAGDHAISKIMSCYWTASVMWFSARMPKWLSKVSLWDNDAEELSVGKRRSKKNTGAASGQTSNSGRHQRAAKGSQEQMHPHLQAPLSHADYAQLKAVQRAEALSGLRLQCNRQTNQGDGKDYRALAWASQDPLRHFTALDLGTILTFPLLQGVLMRVPTQQLDHEMSWYKSCKTALYAHHDPVVEASSSPGYCSILLVIIKHLWTTHHRFWRMTCGRDARFGCIIAWNDSHHPD